MKDIFHRISSKVAAWTGSALAFTIAASLVIVWAVSGPLFHFSNTWQLAINTCTTIVTFLMVFLIQNTQNRDGKAVQLKLDELIRVSKTARDDFFDLEALSDDELEDLDQEFHRLHEKHASNPDHSIHKLHKKIEAAKKRRVQPT